MTIGIGLICQGGILLASDSMTEGESGLKRFDLDKISFFRSGQYQCGIVRAGTTDLSAHAVDLIAEKLSQNVVKSTSEIRDIVGESMKVVMRKFRESNPNLPHYADEGSFQLILAINDKNEKAHLYVAKSTHCYAREERGGKAFIGTGESLAAYIIGGMDLEKKRPFQVALAALYAVQIAKNMDSHCDGPTRLGMVGTARGSFYDQEKTDGLVSICASFDKEHEQNWINELDDFLKREEQNEIEKGGPEPAGGSPASSS